MTAPAALDYFARLLHCDTRFTDTFAGNARVQVDTGITVAEEYPDLAALPGTPEFLSIGFRQAKNLGDMGDALIVRDMLEAVVRFLDDFPEAKGTFAFNYEIILVQRLGAEGVILDHRFLEPDGDNRHGTLDALLAKYPIREIDQVLL